MDWSLYSYFIVKYLTKKVIKMKKVILVVETIEEQFKVARLVNSIVDKIHSKKELNEGIILSFEEAELLSEIVVSIGRS